LAANRRNAARSCGPRTTKGKARVARNAIKHGFFADAARWTEQQHRDFAATFDGLREDFLPQSEREEICVAIIADSYVRMAAMLRYENIAAVKYHQQCERDLNAQIATADATEAARLSAHREKLRRAGLWRPTIPGPREAKAIIRYEGRLHRAISAATAELDASKASNRATRTGKLQKQSHFIERNRGIFDSVPIGSRASARAGATRMPPAAPNEKREPRHPTSSKGWHGADQENAKTNPLSSMFGCNRHERRRAMAMARRRRIRS
jgi:hypothetical protein